MLGSSRTSLRLLNEAVDAAFDDPGLGQAGSDLLAITDLLTREKSLRLALADGGLAESGRKEILERLVGGKVSPLALSLSTKAVGLRWSSDADLVDALELAGASALIGQAEKAGTADRVAEELFRFGRVVDANGDLQLTLSGSGTPVESRQAIVADLLANKADDATVQLASFVVTHLRGRRIDEALQTMVELAAVRRGELAAVIRVAGPMEPQQEERLAAALRNLYGQPVQLSIEVDPEIIGGISVQVGDELIDGTLAHKLNQARRRLAG
jgi:F-type H+-transporting ATPase subunit delta